ncbi:uncharacterized protein Dvar_01460 [Desulfosarcina variabilis str. Montpellier]|uniref:hypothetical protein n=1 Tax=Desulfosarcina variabilis TaxID=2300 RepID=UPI003AFA2611
MNALTIDSSREGGEWYAGVINDNGLIGGNVIDDGNDTVDYCYPYYWPTENNDPIALEMPEIYPYGKIYGINANGQMGGGCSTMRIRITLLFSIAPMGWLT